jgi:transposase
MAQFLVPRRSTLVRREGTLEEILPTRHLVRFVWRILESFDFSTMEKLYASIQGGSGRPPYHPRVLSALWIYGMAEGFETAAAIAKACTNRDDFRWLAGGLIPCDQTLLNFLTAAAETLPSIWVQVLKAMHQAGHIDLSILAEDGTKLRADASPRSFHTAEDIDVVIQDLKVQIAQKLEELVPPEQSKRYQAKLRALQERLQRAQQATRELQERVARKGAPRQDAGQEGARARSLQTPRRRLVPGKFDREDFRHDTQKDVMVCPAGQELRFVGEYPTGNGRGTYRLYRRPDCTGCPQKAQCTQAKGRKLKVSVQMPAGQDPPPSATPTPADTPPTSPTSSAAPSGEELATKECLAPQAEPCAPMSNPACQRTSEVPSTDRTFDREDSLTSPEAGTQEAPAEAEENEEATDGPLGSLTDPEAVFMLATSQKRFEPSYNADLTVTRHGIIVSQFLTKETNDYGHFPRALPAVLSALGTPDAWAGDGHYSTVANLLLAEQAGVALYAPLQDRDSPENGKFSVKDFRPGTERDILICPAGQELRKIGTYGQAHPYDLYVRKDCGECPLKSKCTNARGRKVKRLHTHPLVQALEARMKEVGEKIQRFRRCTVEPVNGQIKQHGLGRFHVRGLARCGTVLALGCIAHNLMKWKAREQAQALKQAS